MDENYDQLITDFVNSLGFDGKRVKRIDVAPGKIGITLKPSEDDPRNFVAYHWSYVE